jgi:hypothetical protein
VGMLAHYSHMVGEFQQHYEESQCLPSGTVMFHTPRGQTHARGNGSNSMLPAQRCYASVGIATPRRGRRPVVNSGTPRAKVSGAARKVPAMLQVHCADPRFTQETAQTA